MSKTETSGVRVEHRSTFCEIILSSPPWNILDRDLIAQLRAALSEVESSAAHAFLIRAEGKGFCAGVSVPDHLPGPVEEMLPEFTTLLYKIHTCSVPSVAAVHGAALGGGLELACAVDVLFVSEECKLGQPEIQLAALAPAAAVFLPRRLNYNRAADLLFSGRTIRGETAASWGLAEFCCSEAGLLEQARHYCESLGKQSRSALRLCKHALLDRAGTGETELRAVEKIYLEQLVSEPDYREGLEAFMEKRKPLWKGAKS